MITASDYVISALFRVITQRTVVLTYRSYGMTSCTETSARNYHHTLRNIPEECRYFLLDGVRLRLNYLLVFRCICSYGR